MCIIKKKILCLQENNIMKAEKISRTLDEFLLCLDSLFDTLPMMNILLKPELEKIIDEMERFKSDNLVNIENEDNDKDEGEKAYSLKVEDYPIFKKIVNNAITLTIAPRIINESLFVSLVSKYDAFFAKLLRAIYLLVPEIIESSDRSLTLSQLTELGSIEAAKELIIEKEIETVLRKSHKEHFTYLETKLNMPLTKDLPIFTTFIELTERRNLFVHCDGIVSNQYISVCKENKCDISTIKVGDKLSIDIDYFKKAYYCLYELSVKLAHTIWRKICKEDIEDADRHLNNICYNLLVNKQLDLADILLSFAYNQKKHSNDMYKSLFIINAALSKYLQDKKDNAIDILRQKDWSACSNDFQLANYVLNEDYKACYKLMKKIGTSGDVEKENYRQWPLFEKIRELEDFKKCYFEIFNEEYKVIEIPLRPIEKLINETQQKKQLKELSDSAALNSTQN